jgi:dihydrolipoamide dehydrogenase
LDKIITTTTNPIHYTSQSPTHATIIIMRIILSVVFMATLADAFAPLSIGSSTTGGRTSSSSSSSTSLAAGSDKFDFDVAIVGCGVGGHGAALHARAQSLNTAVFAANDVGGTCVNRGCVPSKALLAASGRVRDMQNEEHLAALGITVDGAVKYDRAGIAAHAQNLADKVKMNLEGSLTGLGVQVIPGRGVLTGKPHEIKDESTGKIYTAKVT